MVLRSPHAQSRDSARPGSARVPNRDSEPPPRCSPPGICPPLMSPESLPDAPTGVVPPGCRWDWPVVRRWSLRPGRPLHCGRALVWQFSCGRGGQVLQKVTIAPLYGHYSQN